MSILVHWAVYPNLEYMCILSICADLSILSIYADPNLEYMCILCFDRAKMSSRRTVIDIPTSGVLEYLFSRALARNRVFLMIVSINSPLLHD